MRERLVPAVATLSAGALLVLGVDYATFAANGDSLILGHSNRAQATTSLVKPGPGPTLALSSEGDKRPSLTVSSSARVRHLNADLLDGKSARALASNAITYRAGDQGEVFQGLAVWALPIPRGIYQVSFKVGLQPTVQDGPTFEVICGVADLNTVTSPTPNIYTAESGSNSGQGIPTLLSGAESVRVAAAARPGAVCVRPGDGGEFTFFAPMTVSWTRITHRTVKHAQQIPAPVTPRSLRSRGSH